MERKRAGEGTAPGRAWPGLLLLLLLLLWTLFSGTGLAEETHTLVLRFRGGGYVGFRDGVRETVTLSECQPVKASDGSEWTVERLQALPDFRILGAGFRWTAEEVRGTKLKYALRCGTARTGGERVLDGRNLWDAKGPATAWLAEGAEPLCLEPDYRKNQRGFRVATDSACLQIVFSTSARLPAFPADRIREDPLYDATLSLLEQESPFIARYDETADSLLQAQLPLGVPYYFAGRNPEKFLHRYFPRSTTDYYRPDHMYFCGLDCIGLTYLAWEARGLEEHPSIPTLLQRGIGSKALEGNAPEGWPALLRPGDLIALQHGTLHILMYLGTLRQFGWTEEDSGEAAEILDAPLVIHCGENPFYHARYQAYIQEMGYANTFPPDGGVTVSVVRRTAEEAPHGGEAPWGRYFGWFLADGSPLTVFPLADCTKIAWYGVN